MGHIISWDDVANRYMELGKIADETVMDPAYIQPAELAIEASLASVFTVPFSSNNLTAKDLSIDETYCRMMITKQPKKAEAMRKSLDERIKSLISGKSTMMIESGTLIPGKSGKIWSSTANYHPATGMGDTLDFGVDSSQISDEEDARG